jgi:hypothetical protein
MEEMVSQTMQSGKRKTKIPLLENGVVATERVPKEVTALLVDLVRDREALDKEAQTSLLVDLAKDKEALALLQVDMVNVEQPIQELQVQVENPEAQQAVRRNPRILQATSHQESGETLERLPTWELEKTRMTISKTSPMINSILEIPIVEVVTCTSSVETMTTSTP